MGDTHPAEVSSIRFPWTWRYLWFYFLKEVLNDVWFWFLDELSIYEFQNSASHLVPLSQEVQTISKEVSLHVWSLTVWGEVGSSA